MEGRGRCDDGLDPRELERQYRAIQKSIESHLDRQLGQLRSQPKLGRSEASEGWYRRWKPEIFAAVLLVLGLWQVSDLNRRLAQASMNSLPTAPPLPSDPLPSDPSSDPTPEAVDLPETAEELARRELGPEVSWKDAWRALVEKRPELVQPWLDAIAEGRDLEPDQISNFQKQSFRGYANGLRQGSDVDTLTYGAMQTGCFEYMVALWLKRQADPQADKIRVDIVPREMPEGSVRELLASFRVSQDFGEPLDLRDPELHVAVAVTIILTEAARAVATPAEAGLD